jgi:cystathionine beta-lyase
MPYELATMRQSWPTHLKQGTVVRFSVGLEAQADLQLDIAQALQVFEHV